MKNLCLILLFFSSFIIAYSQGVPPREEVNLDEVYNQYNLTGEGTLVIIIDRGIDYRHPDFINENGNTRIAYLYDMLDATGSGSNPYGIGTIFNETQINTALTNNDPPLSTDRYGHGTATTGIAAGDGSGTAGLEFQGVAPKATIISIKVTHDPFPPFGGEPGQAGFFNTSYLPVALQFAQDKITELGLPSVTLVNLGSIGGPTDGTSLVARAFDDFVANGNILVCGVGDDGGNDNHASGTITPSQTIELELEKGETGNLRFDLWYSEDDRFTVSVERPNGSILGPFAAPTGPNDSADQNLGDIQLYHRGANTEFFQATSNRRELLIDFSGGTGTYKILLEGTQVTSGEFHATLNPSTHSNTNKFNSFVVAGHSINDYASANNIITPGDYVVQNDWTDINGVFRDITGQGEMGELWIGSSSSPTHDGRLGIDLVAPGEVCHAAYAENTYYEFFSHNVLQNSNGLYGIQNAVSAAAPLLTGVIALMLEANPNRSPLEIKTILQETAREDSFTGTVPNHTWGYGKLDALAAVDRTLGNDEFIPSTIQIWPNPTSSKVNLQLPRTIKKGTIHVYSIVGQILETIPFENTSKVSVELKGPAGCYFLRIQSSEGTSVFKIIKS